MDFSNIPNIPNIPNIQNIHTYVEDFKANVSKNVSSMRNSILLLVALPVVWLVAPLIFRILWFLVGWAFSRRTGKKSPEDHFNERFQTIESRLNATETKDNIIDVYQRLDTFKDSANIRIDNLMEKIEKTRYDLLKTQADLAKLKRD